MRQSFARLICALIAGIVPFVAVGCGGGGGGGGGGNGGGGGGNNTNTVVTGIVRNSLNNDQAVEGATVRIGDQTTTTTTVDQASAENVVGSFTINGVSTGTTTAIVSAPGIAEQTVGLFPGVATGTNTYTLTLNIGQVSGRILGTNGQPANSAFVTVLSQGQAIQAAQDGTFFLPDIPLGATEISVVLGTASVRLPLNIVAGLNSLGDLTLAETPGQQNPPGLPVTIVGRITLIGGDGNTPGAGSLIELYRNGTLAERQTATANGEYAFYVPVGTYTLRVLLGGHREGGGQVQVVSPNNPIRADFALAPQ